MTEGLLDQHDKPMCIRIWLEVGHTCEPCCPGRTLAQDWRLWVRGVDGQEISHFVQKVVFYLKPASAFVYPKRVLQEPPYEIQESGSVSLSVPIHVYLKEDNRPKKIRLKYELSIDNATKSFMSSRNVYFDIEDPSDQLMKNLIRGGGMIIGRADDPYSSKVFLPNFPSINEEVTCRIHKSQDQMTRPHIASKNRDTLSHSTVRKDHSNIFNHVENTTQIPQFKVTETEKSLAMSQSLASSREKRKPFITDDIKNNKADFPRTNGLVNHFKTEKTESSNKSVLHSKSVSHDKKLRAKPKLAYKQADPKDKEKLSNNKANRNKIIKLTPCKHTHKTKPYPVNNACLKCANLQRTLRSVAMTADEINNASRQHIAMNMYECSGHAIRLPPLSDPVFTLPTLPKSLEIAIDAANMNFIGL